MYTVYTVVSGITFIQKFEVWGEALRQANQNVYSHSPERVDITRKDGTTLCTWDKGWTYFGKGVFNG